MGTILESTPLFFTGVFIFGALIGSFLNVVIIRVPQMLEYDWRCQCHELLKLETEDSLPPPGIVFAQSRCPHCGHKLHPLENIPLVSFAFLKGKCSSCKEKISFRYPLIELSTAILFAILGFSFGPTLQCLSALVLTSFLVVMTGIDIDHQLLPDNFTLPLLWLGIILAFFEIHTDLASSVIGAIAGYLTLWTIYHLFRLLTGKEGMGYGDFKLLAALGAWMGWQLIPLIILLSSVVGAIAGLILMATGLLKKDMPMPFGPFIAAAGWVALVWGEHLNQFYSNTGLFS